MPWADFWQSAPWVAAHASPKIDKCINQQRTSCKAGKFWQAKCKACRAVTRLQYTSMAGALQKLRVKWSKWFVSENAVCSRFGSHMQGSQFEMATVPKHTSNTQQYFHYGELAWFHTVGRCGLCGRWTPLTFVSNPRKRVQPVHSPTGIMWVIDIIQGL